MNADEQRTTFSGEVFNERGVAHVDLAANDQQSTAARSFVLFKRGGVDGKIAATHFDGAAQQALEDGVRDRRGSVRNQQRPRHDRAGPEPAPLARAWVEAAARDLDRAALNQNLTVEHQPVQLHRGSAGAHREQGVCAARDCRWLECVVVGCDDLDSAEREIRVEH